MRLSSAAERVSELAENSLMYVGEQRLLLDRRRRLENNVAALQEARRIERLRLVVDVEESRQKLRDALAALDRYDEIDAQCESIHVEILQLLDEERRLQSEAEREISKDAKAAGFQYGRPELAGPGAVKRAVAERKARVEHVGASPREIEAI